MQADLESRLSALEAENESLRRPSPGNFARPDQANASRPMEESFPSNSEARDEAPVAPTFSALSPMPDQLGGNSSDLMVREVPEDQASLRNSDVNDSEKDEWRQERQNAMLRGAVESSIHSGNLLGDPYSDQAKEEIKTAGNEPVPSRFSGSSVEFESASDDSEVHENDVQTPASESDDTWSSNSKSSQNSASQVNSRGPLKNDRLNDGRLGSYLGLRSQDDDVEGGVSNSFQNSTGNAAHNRRNNQDLDADVLDILSEFK